MTLTNIKIKLVYVKWILKHGDFYLTSIKLHLMQATQGGEIGLVLSSQIFIPFSSKAEDVAAAKRSLDFYTGWLVQLTKSS